MLSSTFKRSLRNRSDWSSKPMKRAMSAAKYVLRSAWYGEAHRQWLAFIANTPIMSAIIARDPRLLERYQHRYISLRFSSLARLEIIRDHYDFVTSRWPAALLHSVYVERTAHIGTLTLRDGSPLHIVLKAPAIKGLEGELGVYLVNDAGMTLSSIIVTLANGGSRLLIGCVQGAHASAGKDAVRELTRQCHGLRPKNLLLSLAYGVAASSGSTAIYGVGEQVHPFAGLQDKIKSDYNGFWLEAGGELQPDGLFKLPSCESPRDIATVESKHRSAFRRREALRAEAVTLLQRAFAPLDRQAANQPLSSPQPVSADSPQHQVA